MKKVGIITFHNAHNYGAVLQAYALQETVRTLGYEPYIINYKNKKVLRPYKLIQYSKKNPVKCVKKLYSSFKNYSINKIKYDKFEYFISEKLNLTKRYNSVKNLKNNFPKLDCYITGSDQVWNTGIVGELSDAYTLNFGDDKINRISYAASVGNSSIEEKYKQDYKNKLNKINYISVREESAKENLKEILNKNIEVVLDPTLLLSMEEWNKRIENKEKINEKYIFAYMVQENEEYKKIVDYLAKETGLKVIHFNEEHTAEPFDFINLIKNAEYVVATSFHATVFSIIFNKKFFIVPHEKTGLRVINLLEKLGIENRVYYKLQDFENIDYNFETDYEKVKGKLEIEKEKSIKFLKGAIEDKKDE